MRSNASFFAAFGSCLVVLGAGIAGARVARPPVTSRPAAEGNYRQSDRSTITAIVIHKAEGDDASAWFESPEAGTSAHYDVHYDGSIYQSVPDQDIAWHAGNGSVNATTIGIEHSGYIDKDDVTEAEYRASARLTAYLCATYGIPIDRRHVYGHNEVPDPGHPGELGGANHHRDPGPYWNWDHYMALVRDFASQPELDPAPPVNGTNADASRLAALEPARTPAAEGLPAPAIPAAGLQVGSRGSAVRTLQDALRAAGFDPGPTDGIYGSRTAAAVAALAASRTRGLAGSLDGH